MFMILALLRPTDQSVQPKKTKEDKKPADRSLDLCDWRFSFGGRKSFTISNKGVQMMLFCSVNLDEGLTS